MNPSAIVLAVITCFSTLLGGSFAARRRKNIGILGAFAAGVLITTSLLDLLPQTFRLATSVNVVLEDVMALTVVGFLFLYIISRVITAHVFGKDGEYIEVRHPLGGLFATSELSVHSFIDGLAIGFGIEAATSFFIRDIPYDHHGYPAKRSTATAPIAPAKLPTL